MGGVEHENVRRRKQAVARRVAYVNGQLLADTEVSFVEAVTHRRGNFLPARVDGEATWP